MREAKCTHQCVGKKAGHYFRNGFHCAEAVASAVLESHDADPALAIAHATPFGGGMGKSHCETCGALSGGLIAIGHLHGRSEAGVEWDIPATMAKTLRETFVARFGETGCGTLRDRFGEDQMDECEKLVAIVTDATMDILTR